MKDDSRILCEYISFCCNIWGPRRDPSLLPSFVITTTVVVVDIVRFVFLTAVGPYQTERKSPGRLIDDDGNELITTTPFLPLSKEVRSTIRRRKEKGQTDKTDRASPTSREREEEEPPAPGTNDVSFYR